MNSPNTIQRPKLDTTTATAERRLQTALEFIADVPWREASTFRNSPYPHEYIVREWWEGGRDRRNHSKIYPYDPDMLDRVDLFLRTLWAYGKMENFLGRDPNAYLYVGGYKYWQLGSVINRTDTPEKTFGEQWSPSPSAEPTIRCWEAPVWDRTHNPPVVELPELADRSVLHVGCGTGWLLDQIDVDPSRYLGLDTSVGMLNQHIYKHPHHQVRAQTLVDYLQTVDNHWDYAVVSCELSDDEIVSLGKVAGETNRIGRV